MRLVDQLRSVLKTWAPHIENPASVDTLSDSMVASAIPALSFYVMLGLATAIATLGLLSNSAPVVIGAMIVAPLMQPIISFAFGIVVFDWKMIVYAALTITSGVVLVIGFAFATTEVIGLRLAGSEVLSRTAPTLLDLGIACASGAAGAYVHTRKGIANSIAGVAVSVALVPPLCVVGIGFALGRRASTDTAQMLSEIGLRSGGEAVAQGAFTLFATNLIGIVVFAGLVFILHRYGKWKRALLGLAVLGLATVFVFQPLSDAFYQIYVKGVTARLLTTLMVKDRGLFTGESEIQNIVVDYQGKTVRVSLDVTSPRDGVEGMQERVDVLQAHLEQVLNESVEISARVIVVDALTITSNAINLEAVDQDVLEDFEN